MLSAEFELATLAIKQPQTYVLIYTATVIENDNSKIINTTTNNTING